MKKKRICCHASHIESQYLFLHHIRVIAFLLMCVHDCAHTSPLLDAHSYIYMSMCFYYSMLARTARTQMSSRTLTSISLRSSLTSDLFRLFSFSLAEDRRRTKERRMFMRRISLTFSPLPSLYLSEDNDRSIDEHRNEWIIVYSNKVYYRSREEKNSNRSD